MSMSIAEYRTLIGRRSLRPASPPDISPYRSKLEASFAKVGHLYVTEQTGQTIMAVLYEPATFYIPGGRYKPDFCLITDEAMLWIEVKGSRKQKNYRDSRSKLRAVAAIYRGVKFYRFFQAMRIRGTWEIEEIR